MWDILANQNPSSEEDEPFLDANETIEEEDAIPESYTPPANHGGESDALCRYPQLNFVTKNAFMLGSPISVFLKIRNQEQSLAADFYLKGCRCVFNIFHPYDPVAYRIEPLLERRNADIGPRIMHHWNGGFRVQYQTKRIWKRIVDETLKTQQSVAEAVEGYMTGMGLLDAYTFEDDECDAYETVLRPVCGALNQGRRIDYMLQEKEIENANEYVSALAAHSSYWIEKDVSLFIARQIVRSTVERKLA